MAVVARSGRGAPWRPRLTRLSRRPATELGETRAALLVGAPTALQCPPAKHGRIGAIGSRNSKAVRRRPLLKTRISRGGSNFRVGVQPSHNRSRVISYINRGHRSPPHAGPRHGCSGVGQARDAWGSNSAGRSRQRWWWVTRRGPESAAADAKKKPRSVSYLHRAATLPSTGVRRVLPIGTREARRDLFYSDLRILFTSLEKR